MPPLAPRVACAWRRDVEQGTDTGAPHRRRRCRPSMLSSLTPPCGGGSREAPHRTPSLKPFVPWARRPFSGICAKKQSRLRAHPGLGRAPKGHSCQARPRRAPYHPPGHPPGVTIPTFSTFWRASPSGGARGARAARGGRDSPPHSDWRGRLQRGARTLLGAGHRCAVRTSGTALLPALWPPSWRHMVSSWRLLVRFNCDLLRFNTPILERTCIGVSNSKKKQKMVLAPATTKKCEFP